MCNEAPGYMALVLNLHRPTSTCRVMWLMSSCLALLPATFPGTPFRLGWPGSQGQLHVCRWDFNPRPPGWQAGVLSTMSPGLAATRHFPQMAFAFPDGSNEWLSVAVNFSAFVVFFVHNISNNFPCFRWIPCTSICPASLPELWWLLHYNDWPQCLPLQEKTNCTQHIRTWPHFMSR